MTTPAKIAILGSHAGSNAQALLDAYKNKTLAATPVLVISNNANSMILQRAKNAGVPAIHLSRETCNHDLRQLDKEMAECMKQHEVQWIVLAGYMRPIGSTVIKHWQQRIINIHPGKLPQFGGKGMYGDKVHQAVLEAKMKETTVTIHYVDEQYDHGAIIAEKNVPVLPGDTVQSLKARVQKTEHEFYAQTLNNLLQEPAQ